jgi:H+/Cl- antiporter ClcA
MADFTGRMSWKDLLKNQARNISVMVLLAIGYALISSMETQPSWVLLVLQAIVAALGAGLMAREILADVDAISAGEDLHMWSLSLWRPGLLLASLLLVILAVLMIWWSRLFAGIVVPMLIYALASVVIAMFIRYKLLRRQKLVGIWRSK